MPPEPAFAPRRPGRFGFATLAVGFALAWLIAAASLLVAARLGWSKPLATPASAYLIVALAASAVGFVANGYDKWCACRDRRRVPERVLHGLSALGGWPGSLLAQRLFRHKTSKLSFQLTFWLIVAAHVAFVAWTIAAGT